MDSETESKKIAQENPKDTLNLSYDFNRSIMGKLPPSDSMGILNINVLNMDLLTFPKSIINGLLAIRGAVRTGSTGSMEPVDFWKSLKKTCKYRQLLTTSTNSGTRGLKS